MRLGEAIPLDRADADLDGGVLTIRDGKFGRSRLVLAWSLPGEVALDLSPEITALTPRWKNVPNRVIQVPVQFV